MDISGLTNTTSGASFPGYGGTAALPSLTQAKIMVQSQTLGLLPSISSSNLGSMANIYDAVGKQTLGALSGLSGLQITQLSMGIGDGQTTSALPTSPDSAAAAQNGGGSSPAHDPAIGATLDRLLKESGYVAPDANPYAYTRDFFSDQTSRGGLLDSRG